jgi:hypothetical protein
MIENLMSYISNVRNHTHVLRTRVKKGEYADSSYKIPDALMMGVIDFVEIDCFHASLGYAGIRCQDKQVAAYANQSYLRKYLFPSKVPNDMRGICGVAYLIMLRAHTCVTDREIERSPYTKIITAYRFASGRYQSFDSYTESGLDKIVESNEELGYSIFRFSPEKLAAYERANDLESVYEKELSKHCNSLIRYREYMCV